MLFMIGMMMSEEGIMWMREIDLVIVMKQMICGWMGNEDGGEKRNWDDDG